MVLSYSRVVRASLNKPWSLGTSAETEKQSITKNKDAEQITPHSEMYYSFSGVKHWQSLREIGCFLRV